MRTRLRHVAQINPLSRRFDRLHDDDLVPFLPMERVWPGDRLDLGERRLKSAITAGYTRFESNDVLVPKITPTFEASRAVILPKLPSSVAVGTTELHVVRPGPEIDARYLCYIFHAHDFLKIGESAMYGVAGQQRVPDGVIRDWIVDLPPLSEQRRIADFLDSETARLDDLISLRSGQVEKSMEALQGEAARLTGRLRNNSMHAADQWVALRRVVDSVQTGVTPTDLLRAKSDVEDVPWYTPAAIRGTYSLGEAEKSIRMDDARTLPRFLPGSLLIVGIGESLGKVADLDHLATGNQQLTAITPNGSIDRRFLFWQLFAAHEEIRNWAPYSRIRILNNENLKSFMVRLPAICDQFEIREELDRRLSDLQGFRATAGRFAIVASERRQALITAVVTGQIDVTTARGVDV